MFELQNGGPSTLAGNIPLKVQVPITYPTVNTSVLEGFTLNIYNSEGNAISGIGDVALKIIETAVDPTDVVTNLVGPIAIGGFSTTQFPTQTNGQASIIGNTDGVSTQNAQYQMEFTTTLPIPSEGIMVMTVPSGVAVPNASASSISMICNAGCSTNGALTYSNS